MRRNRFSKLRNPQQLRFKFLIDPADLAINNRGRKIKNFDIRVFNFKEL